MNFLFCRTVTQEDPGDNQVSLEEITQMVREEITRAFLTLSNAWNILLKLNWTAVVDVRVCVFCVWGYAGR